MCKKVGELLALTPLSVVILTVSSDQTVNAPPAPGLNCGATRPTVTERHKRLQSHLKCLRIIFRWEQFEQRARQ